MDEITGDIFLRMHKRPIKARNSSGASLSAQKGAINQFRGIPNSRPGKGTGKGKGKMMRWRCGSLDRRWGASLYHKTHPDIMVSKEKAMCRRLIRLSLDRRISTATHILFPAKKMSRRSSRLMARRPPSPTALLTRRPVSLPRPRRWNLTPMGATTTPGGNTTLYMNGDGWANFYSCRGPSF